MKKQHKNKVYITKECEPIGDYQLTGETVYQALARLKPIVHHTPLITSATTNKIVGKNVYFKMENQQKTGAFKFRGATFKLMRLSKAELRKGVITASAGNHAQGLAYAASKIGVKATIFMPEKTPTAKVEATKAYGADVVLTGAVFQDAYEASMKRQLQTGAVYVHPFDDYDIIAGQGTIAMEMLKQEDRIDTFIVPIGGGGLISGIAIAAKHVNKNIRVIGVQAENSRAMYNLYHDLSSKGYTPTRTIAEGIDVKEPGKITSKIIRDYVDDIITVSEEEIATSILYMLERSKTLMEGAGATALAGLFKHQDKIKSRYCGIVVSGGNIDISSIPNIQRLADQRTQPSNVRTPNFNSTVS